MNTSTSEQNVISKSVYRGMLERCNNPKTSNYKYYGAKGIKVKCSFGEFCKIYWERDFCYYCDIKLTNNKICKTRRTIDRINNNGHYEIKNMITSCSFCNASKGANKLPRKNSLTMKIWST